MIIIETCPKCGHDLVDGVICTNPPIPKKSCWNCGWSWEGEREEVIRFPFGGNSFEDKPSYLGKRTYVSLVDDVVIDEITEKAIQEHLATITNINASKYID